MDIIERRLKRREELFSILKQTILFDEFVTSLKDLLDNYPLSVEDLMFIKPYQDVLIYIDELQFEDNTELKQRAIKKFEELSIPLFRDKKLQELGI
jgi:hypothetical protein